jgi:hypothetical protein
MKIAAVVAAVALGVGWAGVAHAERILSPPLPTGVGTSGACYVRNIGATGVSVTVDLFSNNGLLVNLNTCNGSPLPAGRTCVVLVNDLPDDSFAACSATANNVAKLRGTLEVRQISPILRVLVSEDLR